MATQITTIKSGNVNCYLLTTDTGFVLIDTGYTNKRADVVKQLDNAGCQPGDLKLIIITHGDFDHIGNGAFLRNRYAVKIAMHSGDAGMSERGDMFWNRKSASPVVQMIVKLLARLSPADRFTADIALADGDDLSGFGLDAKVLSIPGHSQGSIGILTANGDLFCGDLFNNPGKPAFNSIMDDLAVAHNSFEKLKSYLINTVYPGHGLPFRMDELPNV